MTNAEKYLKDGKATEELIGEMEISLCVPYYEVARFWDKQIKPTLTEDEKVILRNIPKEYIKIRRNDWQEIEFVQEDCKYRTCYLLSHLFKFIKARRKIQYRGATKMKLSRKEKILLGNIITDNYKYIHRDGNGSLWITKDVWLKPKKDPVLNIPYRESDNIFWFGMYRHLFQTIRNGEEYSIEELLKGE